MDNRDLNLYRIFLTLYEQKSISKTASKLYVSQPAISYSLKELESQLGYNLFYRNSKGIEPTIEAKELYSYISAAFNMIKNGEEHIMNLNSLDVGEIKIGAHSHIATFYLMPFIIEFRKKYPNVKFEIISVHTQELVEKLESRKIDIIIGALPINIANKSAEKKMLAKFKNCFVYHKDYFKDIKVDTPEELIKYPLILPSATSSIRTKLDEYMEHKNIKLEPAVESWTTGFMIEMVKNGAGIGYFADNVVEHQPDKDKYEVITFDDSLPTMDICAVYLGDFVIPVLKRFVEFLEENN